MAAWFNANSTPGANIHQLYKLGDGGSVTKWTANPGNPGEPDQGLNPIDLTFFNNAVWFSGETTGSGNQLFKLGSDGSVTQWTNIHLGLNGLFGDNQDPDLTFFNNALWFNGTIAGGVNSGGNELKQLFKLGADGSVTKWTADPGAGFGLDPSSMTVFNSALWFDGDTPGNGVQLYKLGNDGSVTKWTSIGGGFFTHEMVVFDNALWFNGFDSTTSQQQLYKLGDDGSVTKWTADPGFAGDGLKPQNLTVFDDALWFAGLTPANGFQLFKLGNDGSVTKWTSIGNSFQPTDLTVFNDALWFNGNDTTGGRFQLYKLGADGSVTKWTANPGFGGDGLDPVNLTVFNGALWFKGSTPAHGNQLFKLGNDGSVTQWTDIFGGGTGLSPIPLSRAGTAGFDSDSTPLSVANNGLWFGGQNPNGLGFELYKLGTDGSFTFWKDINPGPDGSIPKDWAILG
jgi:hypothetical protein